MTIISRRRALFFAHLTAVLLFSQISYSQSHTHSHLPAVPDSISVPEQRANYIVEHYWDDMSDGLFGETDPDTDEQVIADFLLFETMADKRVAENSFAALLNKISDTESKVRTLLDILFKYLYAFDSPYRDDQLCGEWLGMMLSITQSPLLRARVSFYLELAGNCKPGTTAKNFIYATPDGRTHSLYDGIGSPLLLVFYSPGCRDCRDYENRLNRSEIVRKSVKNGLRILFVCPEGCLENSQWARPSSSEIEKAFACDDSIISEGKYKYRTIPSAYLLDRNMKILLKEPTFVELETGLSELFQ